MKKQRQKPMNRSDIQLQNSIPLNPKGTVLVYVVVLMLIFGILGVVMVSLFSSSIASSITRNDSRRARYMAESGTRYAFSELRKADFDLNFMINTLNATTYNIGGTESFTINVFSPWFESSADQTIPGLGGDLSLNVPIGELPDDFTLPASGVYAINYEYTGNRLADESGSWALVTGFDENTMTLTLDDDFNASSGERVCLAVLSKWPKVINGPINLELSLQAQTVFPEYGGAFGIITNGKNRGGLHEYFYEQKIVYPVADDRVVLRKLTPLPGSDYDNEVSVGTTEASSSWIILSPRNYMVVPTGQSDGTTYGGDYTFGRGIYDSSLMRPGSARPDITADDLTSNLSEQETDTRFFEVDTVADTLRIGRELSDQFGTALYAGDESIGGDQDYCQQGACLFALGVRAFFLVNFSEQGDGITFTLLGKGFPAPATPNNSASSVGGDFELSELMGFAGDSRLVADPDPMNDSQFLATNPDDRGLEPPKIAVEFDTRTNSVVGDPPPDYCSGADANFDSRNDPLASNKDAVQYVFWGRTSGLFIPCRDNNTLYDDNRHDANGEVPTEEWRFGVGGNFSFWRPAIGSDGTIYMSARDATLYALNEDGTEKWPSPFPLGDDNDYMPGIDTKGTPDPSDDVIYSDISGSDLVAIDWQGNQLWRFPVGADIDSTPVVDSDGTIYFGTDAPTNSLFAVNPNGTVRWQFPTGGEVDTVAVLSPDGTTVYFVSNDHNLYALKMAAREADPTGAGGINGN
jgi:hypothetical protein